ncbi:hypothetical protein CE143_13460 [Photorhabdus luminescens]|uniref:Uncharacterized protein n=1 Tax=Photorhabdus akhurstii TaxID=171438 RepID=A0ABX8LUR5_9GAMM|nr:hypothetical protein B0X70_13465 [Photorhabdus akhurstii]UJD75860.1 hypothetical protein CE143_13460 [Photorhabdus luminescens]
MSTRTHSGKVNFHSYIESGVDTRTGTFSSNICLSSLIETQFDIRLLYSPLNQKNVGLGKGWRIPVTVYNEDKKLLSLADGRLFHVTEKKGALILEGGIGDVFFEKIDKFYKVTYRNTGMIELLKINDFSDNKPCVFRSSSLGEILEFNWHKEGKEVKLTGINRYTDVQEIKKSLVTISYSNEKVSLLVFPDSNEKKEFNLTINNNLLTGIENASFSTPLKWKLSYTELSNKNSEKTAYLTEIVSPLNKIETVSYEDDGHNSFKVCFHKIADGTGKSEAICTYYSYEVSYNSYYDDNNDNMLSYGYSIGSPLGSPMYITTVQKQKHNYSRLYNKTIYIYNALYLEEFNCDIIGSYDENIKYDRDSIQYYDPMLRRGSNIETYLNDPGIIKANISKYRAIKDKPFPEQPEFFSLKKEEKTVYFEYKDNSNSLKNKGNSDINRKVKLGAVEIIETSVTLKSIEDNTIDSVSILTTRFEYDNEGRIIKKEHPDGSIDNYSYFKGKTLLLETEKHIPSSNKANEKTYIKKYIYDSFPVKEKKGFPVNLGNCDLMACMLMQHTDDKSGVATYEINRAFYINNPSHFNHGKLEKSIDYLINDKLLLGNVKSSSEIDNLVNKDAKINAVSYKYSFYEGNLKAVMTFTGHDGKNSMTEKVISIQTGLTLSEKDKYENISEYEWDALSRLKKIKNNPKKEFSTTESYDHGIIINDDYTTVFKEKVDNARFAGYIMHTNAQGVKVLTGHDVFNREVQIWKSSPEKGQNKWLLVCDKQYDENFLVTVEKRFDLLPDVKSGDIIVTEDIYRTYYISPFCYFNLHRRHDQQFDITYTFINEVKKTRKTIYIDSINIDDKHEVTEDYILSLLKKYQKSSFVRYDSTSFYSLNYNYQTQDNNKDDESKLCIPAIMLKSGKDIAWFTEETFDSHGNVIKNNRYTLDSEVKDDESKDEDEIVRKLILSPILYSATEHQYGANNKLISLTDEIGNKTDFIYDIYHRVIGIIQPNGVKINKQYAPHTDKELVTQISITNANRTFIPGSQKFDSLERLIEINNGGRIQKYTYKDSSPVPDTMIKPDGTVLQYQNIHELGDVIKSIKGGNIDHQFDYDKTTGQLKRYKDQSGYISQLTYDGLGNITGENITPIAEGVEQSLSQIFSVGGKCIEYNDITGKKQEHLYNLQGKLIKVVDDDIETEMEYAAFDRLMRQSVLNKRDQTKLVMEFGYDIFGREISRTITPSGQADKMLTMTQRWHKNDQLASRMICNGTIVLRDETFKYNSLNMLVEYICTGDELPLDGYGKPISKLTLSYDALGNITQCITQFNSEQDEARFIYSSPHDPCQLTEVRHTHKDYPVLITLEYDANGCMTKNEQGQILTYDALNRLKTLKAGEDIYLYHYDPQGKLVSRSKLETRREWYYQQNANYPLLSNELAGELKTRVSRVSEQITGIITSGLKDDKQRDNILLIGADEMNSPILTLNKEGKSSLLSYSPFGSSAVPLIVGFTGQMVDDVSGVYHLGERQYSPCLFRFTTPDSWSPFGDGGPNSYAYIDPINCRDPQGHISWGGIFGIIFGVITVVVGVVTLGAGLAAMAAAGMTLAVGLSVIGGVATVASGGFAIAAGAIMDTNPELAETFSWVAFGLGVVGMCATMGAGFAQGAGATMMRSVSSNAPRIGRMGGRYVVQERVLGSVSRELLGPVTSRSGVAMESHFMLTGTRMGGGTAASMIGSGPSVGSALFLDMLGSIAASAPARMIGLTIGMEALLGLGLAGFWHSKKSK